MQACASMDTGIECLDAKIFLEISFPHCLVYPASQGFNKQHNTKRLYLCALKRVRQTQIRCAVLQCKVIFQQFFLAFFFPRVRLRNRA